MKATLPWPPKACSPNARSRTWHKHAAAKKAYRAACGWAAKAAGLRTINATAIAAVITFHPPNRNRRDDDNTIASFKSGRDGIADVLGVDDGKWQVRYEFGEAREDGAVVFEVVAAEFPAIGVAI